MENKRILYFDYWTKGYRNFMRIDKKLKEIGYKTLLVHIDSWLSKKYVKESNMLDLQVRDISFYQTNRISKVLDIYNPVCVIILNLSFLLDRAFVIECRRRDIKIIYLSHGMLTSVDQLENTKKVLDKHLRKTVRRKFSKKNWYSLLNYFEAHRSLTVAYKLIVNLIRSPSEYTVFPRFTEELLVDKALVYFVNDYKLLTMKYKFPKDIVKVVGNPELDSFFNYNAIPRADFLNSINLNMDQEYVLYMEDGLVQDNLRSAEDWYEFILDIKQILSEYGLQLIIKLHPRSDGMHDMFFKNNGIFYYLNLSMEDAIHHSKFVLSHSSSTIVYAIIMGKCVKSPRWGMSKGLPINYPEDVVSYYHKKEDFIRGIDDVSINIDSYHKFLQESIGTVDGNSIDKIIAEIDSTI